ncbi:MULTISPECIES: integrase core domain-containing protein [Pectobacterium]|uniref:Integrase core domain-containing protein n=1 Tax=Pectobacterium parvum TaxID=2778550 RepID=A0AAP9IGM5_9GAMM|nr:hypothetical protein [Pectobacterium parvum]QHQ24355.1 transposase [Pectobacterium parvum]
MLYMYLLRTLSEMHVLTEDWRTKYNEKHLHSSQGNMPPLFIRGKIGRVSLLTGLTGRYSKLGSYIDY